MGRFIQADTIVPGAGNPQAWDRYAYTNNNPARFIDPSGHKVCDDVDNYGNCITEPLEKKRSQPPQPPIRSIGEGDSVPDATLEDFAPDDNLIGNNHGCLQSFWSCYDPDAIIWGVGISGSEPGLYNIAGLEEIVMFSDFTRATYTYGGQGSSAGVGVSAVAYGGIVFNLEDPNNYIGPFGSTGITISVADVGITALYFWDSSKEPLSDGTTQGLAVGYAPGAQASAWWSSTIYTLTWRSDR